MAENFAGIYLNYLLYTLADRVPNFYHASGFNALLILIITVYRAFKLFA